MSKYNFLIIGAGFFGAVVARKLTDAGFKCLIVEKEDKVGGLCADQFIDGINIHDYSAHVIHTDNQTVWDFLNKYDTIERIDYTVRALNNGTYYSFPINMNSFKESYSEIYPSSVCDKLNKDIKNYGCEYQRNLEEESIYRGGFKFYINCIKGYYEKLYGDDCKYLSTACIREIRKDFTYNQNYYPEKYIGVPTNGYTKLVENIIGDDIDILLNTDYLKNRDKFDSLADIIISTIPIDKFCNYIYGALPWRTLDFEIKDFTKKDLEYFLGLPTVKISDPNNGLLQIDEFKHLHPSVKSDKNYLMYTYPSDWDPDKKCLFAKNSERSEELLEKYISFVKEHYRNVIFGGRQGLFRNIFIDEAVQLAFDMSNDIIENLKEPTV